LVKEVGFEIEKAKDFADGVVRYAAVGECGVGDGFEIVEGSGDGEMEKAISYGGGHDADGGSVSGAIAGGDNDPIRWQGIVADFAIEDELLGDTHHRARAHIKLIEK
jgi:hypothetical protein